MSAFKIYVILVFLVLVEPLFAANAKSMDLIGFSRDLGRLRELYETGSTSSALIIDQLRQVDRDYDPAEWIGQISSDDWGHPSTARLNRISEIEDIVEPNVLALVGMAFDPKLKSESQRALKFIYFSKPTRQLRDRLLLISSRGDGHYAFSILFQLGLFDNDVRAKFDHLIEVSDLETKRRLWSMSAEFGLTENLPAYVEMLSKPFDPNTVKFVGDVPAESNDSALSDYRVASNAIMSMGDAAHSALPLLQTRLSEIKAAFPTKYQPLTGSIVAAIAVLEGKRAPTAISTIAGRGMINLAVGPYRLPDTSTGKVPPAALRSEQWPKIWMVIGVLLVGSIIVTIRIMRR